jgi:hypothetical protein
VYTHFIQSFICQWAFALFPPFGSCELCYQYGCMSIFQIFAFNSFGYIFPLVDLLGHMLIIGLIFLRIWQTIFHGILADTFKYTYVYIAILVGMKWHPTVIVFHFSNDCWCWKSFHFVYWTFVYLLNVFKATDFVLLVRFNIFRQSFSVLKFWSNTSSYLQYFCPWISGCYFKLTIYIYIYKLFYYI